MFYKDDIHPRAITFSIVFFHGISKLVFNSSTIFDMIMYTSS